MIIDAVANLKHYTKLFPNIPDALEAMNRIEQQEFGKKYFFEGGFFTFVLVKRGKQRDFVFLVHD